MDTTSCEIKDVSFHRNGVGGVGFYAVLFLEKEQGLMIASLFDDPGYCAVYSIPELAKENIKFANGNSWRGDVYEKQLRPLVAEFLEKGGTNRVGPFSL